jgi:poly(3-hydroxybutyrate) depolymerase
MKRYVFFTIFIALFFFHGVSYAQNDTLNYDGLDRIYRLHLPSSYTGEDSLPLVLVFHALNQGLNSIESTTGMSEKSDSEDFIVVYPRANNIYESWDFYSLETDDIGFVSSLIDTLCAEYNIDTTRIYAAGFSMGSIFCYCIAHRLPNRISAIAPVAYPFIFSDLLPTRAMPIIHFQSKDDNYAPDFAVRSTMNYWRDVNGCETEPDTIFTDDGVTGERWSPQSNNAEVILYSRNTGGHTWPTSDINATDLIWEFFEQHSREDSAANEPVPQTPDSNLACGCKVYYSSIESGNFYQLLKTENVVDGYMATRWASESSDPQWITVDLDSTRTIGGVILYWENAYGRDYEIQVSIDSIDWTTVSTINDGDGGTDEISFSQVQARYVRMYGTQRGTSWGYSLWELEVYENFQAGIDEQQRYQAVDSALHQNYPNPFNSVTTIEYSIPKKSDVIINVYNLAGQVVDVLVNQIMEPGHYSVQFDASKLGLGVYFYKIQAGSFSDAKKCLVIR